MPAIAARLTLKKILTVAIALVWLINGLFCIILGLVPRHQMIVARILGENYSFIATKTIGLLEVLMFAWILSRMKSRLNACIQMILVAAMNIIEFILAPDLLLFGRINIIVATFFIIIIFINEFILTGSTAAK
jgi:hypothetical protein